MTLNVTYSLAAVLLVSALSFIGALTLTLREKVLDDFLFVFVSFAAGGILGSAYLDLVPEAIHLIGSGQALALQVLGFTVFFLLERLVYWFHGHGHGNAHGVHISSDDSRIKVKRYVYLNLVGDAVHNAMDGVVIASSFFAGVASGLATTAAVIFHEIPQEMGDFAILVHGGISKMRALGLNFVTAATSVLGAVCAYVFLSPTESQLGTVLAFMGGGFVYLSASELIPEIRREENIVKSLIQFAFFSAGLAFIWLVIRGLPE